MGESKEPDRVEHDKMYAGPANVGPEVADITRIHEGDDTYTGYGSSREEANKAAGEKYSRGEKDK